MRSVFLAFLIVLLPVLAHAEKRVALVIGNGAYEHVPDLTNPTNDAKDIGEALSRMGFDVTLGQNFDFRDMRLALRDFSDKAAHAEYAVVYFAGHGVEIDNTNYLIPVNAELRSDRDVEFETLQLASFLTAVDGASKLRMVLVDACRNNPFLSSMSRSTATRSVGRGLADIDPGGTLVGYAARSGTLALDGDVRNSPYARALLDHLEEPGLEVGKMFRKIRDQVFKETDGYQQPFTYGSLPGEDIFLVAAAPTPETQSSPEAAASAASSTLIEDFTQADINNNYYSWTVFLKKYEDQTDNELVQLAARKLDSLVREKEIRTRRLNREPWLTGTREPGKAELVFTLEERKLLQEALIYVGHDVGAIDGTFGPKTRTAISSARVGLGLQPGTQIDVALLRALPNVPEMKALQSGTARRFSEEELPEALEPRLAKVFRTFPRGEYLWGYFRGHLYVVVKGSGAYGWHNASVLANKAGGHLATITSAEENRFIYELFSQDPRFIREYEGALFGPMFGLFQADRSNEPAGGWAWVNGEPLQYRNFSRGNPDNFQGKQHFARFFRPANLRGSDVGPRWWDDTSQNLWVDGFILEVD